MPLALRGTLVTGLEMFHEDVWKLIMIYFSQGYI